MGNPSPSIPLPSAPSFPQAIPAERCHSVAQSVDGRRWQIFSFLGKCESSACTTSFSAAGYKPAFSGAFVTMLQTCESWINSCLNLQVFKGKMLLLLKLLYWSGSGLVWWFSREVVLQVWKMKRALLSSKAGTFLKGSSRNDIMGLIRGLETFISNLFCL